MKIVITDSGLGGVSVCASIEKLAYLRKEFPELELIFFNALPDNGFGYNSMKEDFMKAEIFDSALEAMESKYNPDRILIACNTLTAVYPKTNFAQKTKTSVLGVIDFGVNLAIEEYYSKQNSVIIVLGTPTTINSELYKQKLIMKGIEEKKIIGQPCFLLESEIQKNPFSSKVSELIERFTKEAIQKISVDYDNVIIILGCTHYAYSISVFQEIVSKYFSVLFNFVNPNQRMAESVFGNSQSQYETKISVQLFSQAIISEEEKIGIGNLIKNESPKTYNAIKNPIIDKSLFSFRKL